MASGGGDPPSGKKDDLKRDDPDFLHEQMLLTGIYGEEEEEENEGDQTQTPTTTAPTSRSNLNPMASIFVPSSRFSMTSAPGQIEGLRPPRIMTQQGPYASAPVFQPPPAVHDIRNLDCIIEYPIQIPNNQTFDYYIDVGISIYHLMRIYSFLDKLEKRPEEHKETLPVLIPVLYNFAKNNRIKLSKREINLLFTFVYEVTHEFCPRAVPMPLPLMHYLPPTGGGPAPMIPQTGAPGSATAPTQPSGVSQPWTVGSGARPKTTQTPSTSQTPAVVPRAITGQTSSASASTRGAQMPQGVNRGVAAAYTGSIGQRYTSGGTGASAPTLDDLKAKAAAAGTSLRFDPHQRKEKELKKTDKKRRKMTMNLKRKISEVSLCIKERLSQFKKKGACDFTAEKHVAEKATKNGNIFIQREL